MFTGIIETIGKIEEVRKDRSNLVINISSEISTELKIDQSVSHNGVCLTVTSIDENSHSVTAVDETIQKTNLGSVSTGDLINLERCLRLSDRLDGHLVQGHIDTTGICSDKKLADGSWVFSFRYPKEFDNLIVSKGSIAINGVSLTVVDSLSGIFTVAIIPYTYKNTNFLHLDKGSRVNLEFDIIGKYILKNQQKRSDN